MYSVKQIMSKGVQGLLLLELIINEHLSILLFGKNEIDDYKDLPLPSERKQESPDKKQTKSRRKSMRWGQLQLLMVAVFKKVVLTLLLKLESMSNSNKQLEEENRFKHA